MAQQKIWFDFVSNTIKVEANYLPQTRKVGSKAYKTLLAAKRDNPTATIETFGKREDKYNHITVSQMQTYFEVNGLTDGAAKLKEMRENKETHINKNGRTVRTYNMGKIRQWFMENYRQELHLLSCHSPALPPFESMKEYGDRTEKRPFHR